MSRRLMLLGLLLVVVFGSAAQAASFNEAPMLKEMVEMGLLPPVEERLPKEPFVAEPLEGKIGQYGGTVRILDHEPMYPLEARHFVDPGHPANPVYFKMPESEYLPTFVAGYEESEDAMTIDLFLREGLRWSDGVELTADDYMFTYEHVAYHEELNPGAPEPDDSDYRLVEKVDTYHVRVHSNEPMPFWRDSGIAPIVPMPKHFWSQIHPDFIGADAAQEQAEELGYDEWIGYWQSLEPNSDIQFSGNFPPSLDSHVLVEKTDEGEIWERNPYFFKVDQEGNQLPYIDRVNSRIVADEELIQGRIMSGETDFQARHTVFANAALYHRYADQAGYTVRQFSEGDSGPLLAFNLTPGDPGLREVFSDKRFRQAMSLVINRDEINERIYYGLYRPYQDTALPETPFYRDEYATAYTDYDPERAEELLLDMGLSRDDRGRWLRPDGEQLTWTVVLTARWENDDIMEMLQQQWGDFGIDVSSTTQDRDHARGLLLEGDKIDCWLYTGWRPISYHASAGQLTAFAPMDNQHGGLNASQWGVYGVWFATDGAEGEEPPELLKHLNELAETMLVTADPELREEMMHELLETKAEQLWRIGIVGPRQKLIVAANDLIIPEGGYWAQGWQPYQASRMFFDGRDPLTAEEAQITEFYPEDVQLPILERRMKHGW